MSRMKTGMSGHGRARGFSLIELMITIAVIALIVGLGVPMYGTFTQESTISSASSEFIAALNEARSRAVSERTRVRLDAIGEDWTNGWQSVRVGRPGAEPPADADVVLFVVERLDGDVLDMALDSAETSLLFDREGRLVTDAGISVGVQTMTVALKNPQPGSPGRIITISPLGRVEIERTTEPEPAP